MKVLVCSLLLALSASAVNAQTEETADEESVVVMEDEEMEEEASGPLAELGELPQLFKDSLRCDLLGPLVELDDPEATPRDKNNAYCSADNDGDIAMLTAANGEVNFGLIERLNAAGLNTNTWRVFLSDPANLAMFETEGADSLAVVIEIATAGKDSTPYEDQVFEWSAEEGALLLTENFSDGLEATSFYQYYGQGFIERRQAEALPEHRDEIAEIWKRIMSTQIERYLTARN
jgi:hypothetical protein